MDAKLKPCPFCGGEARVDVFMNHEYVACKHKKNCIFEPSGEFMMFDVSIRKQINAWNRRNGGDGDG